MNLPSTIVAISGSGNVSQFTALKVLELGATVKSLSDSKGSLIASKGFTKNDILSIGQLKLKGGTLESWAGNQSGDRFTYHAGKRPWTLLSLVHHALPGATQNEVSGEEAEALVAAGVRIIAEGSNMGCTEEAIKVFEKARRDGKGVWYAPGSKPLSSSPSSSRYCSVTDGLLMLNLPTEAANCGGVAVSGLEMAQNSQRLAWTTEEVDSRLKSIMAEAYTQCLNAGAKWSGEKLIGDVLPSLLAGANVAGFIKVADAMREQGDWW
ncbi:hypothetical protein C0993_006876 [Termitomyces sp. T159_Od127]|nr:hypothetical protein C0993_006876 [Termitomyces sp. T159_Od127]